MPITLLITSIFGKESDGPASNKASAGPRPIPEVKRPCRIKEIFLKIQTSKTYL